MSEPRWICVGVTDEFHPFCLFTTDSEAEARVHEKWPGHHCLEVPPDPSSSGPSSSNEPPRSAEPANNP